MGTRESLNGWKNVAPKKSKERRARRAPGDNVLPDQFQTLAAVLAFDWCQKTCVFLAPINPKKKHSFQASNDLHTEKEYDMSP